MYLILLCGLLVLVVLIVIVWIAYCVSAAYQQTLTITIPFENTYRYVPNLNREHKYEINSIKITVAGSIKRSSRVNSTITPSSKIKELIEEYVTIPYKNCLLVQEANTFIVDDSMLNIDDSIVLKRCPVIKNPTVENLSIMFFNKLAPLMPKIGSQLVSVKLSSENVNITHSRYKISDYTV